MTTRAPDTLAWYADNAARFFADVTEQARNRKGSSRQ
jgi:hypothetical protein